MIIGFDLDGTLLCDDRQVNLVDPDVTPLIGPGGYVVDKMRQGALPLLKRLADRGDQIWIYTQSYRGRSEVTKWFDSLGVSIDGYVNRQLHEQACEQHGFKGILPLKCPHLYGIQVHVDDDVIVEEQCRDSGCRVIRIEVDELYFEDRVLAALDEND